MLKEGRRSVYYASEPIGPFSQKTNATVNFLKRFIILALCRNWCSASPSFLLVFFFFETKSYYIAPIGLVFVIVQLDSKLLAALLS